MSSGVRCRRQALLSMCVERERVLLLSRRRHLHQGRLAAALPAVPAYARVFPESRHQMGFCTLQPAQIFLDGAVKIRNDPAEFPKLNFQHWKSKKKKKKEQKVLLCKSGKCNWDSFGEVCDSKWTMLSTFQKKKDSVLRMSVSTTKPWRETGFGGIIALRNNVSVFAELSVLCCIKNQQHNKPHLP